MKVRSHLREMHGYTLAESVRYDPWKMFELHEAEHRETECNHTHEEDRESV